MFPGTNHQGEQPGWHFGFVSFLVHYNAFIHLRECEKEMGLIYQVQNAKHSIFNEHVFLDNQRLFCSTKEGNVSFISTFGITVIIFARHLGQSVILSRAINK